MGTVIKELVQRGHDQAAELKSSCGAVDVRSVAQLISDLASHLNVQLARSNALAAENVGLKSAITDHSHSVHFCEVCGKDAPCSTDDVCYALNQTPATDRIYTEAEARGVEKFIASLPSYADTEVDTYDDGVKAAIETTQTVYGPVFIKQLREWADK
ncbi:hypothetical protein MKM07_002182 [Salmonella enterica]|nr:hypothetical protein [Salmonella enterica]EIX4946509.1 hypothetical protein [Salmonella enterica]